MTSDRYNKLITALAGVLIAVVAVQGVVMAKRSRMQGSTRAAGNDGPGRMSLRAPADGAPSASGPSDHLFPQYQVPPLSRPDPGAEAWDPFSEFRRMRQQMDQMFNESFGRFKRAPDFETRWGGTAFSPSMDLEEKEGRYVVRMDIPGADKADIVVNISDRVLEVSGKVDEATEEEGQLQLRKERRSGRFSRRITLPGPVKAGEMEAEYTNGVLVVCVPRADQDNESRSIEVK